MLGRNRELFATLIFVVDGLLVFGAWVSAYWIRFHAIGLPAPLGIPPLSLYLWIGAVLTLVTLLVLRSLHIYRSGRTARLSQEVFAILQGMVIITALAGVASFFTRGELSRATLLLFAGLATAELLGSRLIIRMILRELRRRGRNLRRALVVGTGVSAARVVEKIATHPHFGLEVVGLVAGDASGGPAAESTAPNEGPGVSPREHVMSAANTTSRGTESPLREAARPRAASAEAVPGERSRRPFEELLGHRTTPRVPVIGNVADLPRLVEETHADLVYLALARSEYRAEEEALAQLHDSTAAVRMVPDLARAFTLNASVEDFDGMPVVLVTESPDQGWAGVLKRAFDLVFSALGLVLVSPVLLAVALWVRLDSRGPVLYVQERVGLNGKRFNMIKFRTMRPDAESGDGPGWSRPGDPRRTGAGAVLRRLSLDELPQLWNVLKGEMSLVGPRPERPVYVDRFRASIPRYMLRHHVKAGITGWAQVHGLRGDTPLDERIRYDLDYIRNWSLALDVRILLMTVSRVFRDASAH